MHEPSFVNRAIVFSWASTSFSRSLKRSLSLKTDVKENACVITGCPVHLRYNVLAQLMPRLGSANLTRWISGERLQNCSLQVSFAANLSSAICSFEQRVDQTSTLLSQICRSDRLLPVHFAVHPKKESILVRGVREVRS